MDPNSGQLYETRAAALDAGVKEPVEIIGTQEQAERISAAVKKQYTTEQRIARKKRKKAARASRKNNR